jgi:hypothetical protein
MTEISRAKFYSELWNNFFLSSDVIKKLESHYILKMSGHELKYHLTAEGTIRHYGVEYILICPHGFVREALFKLDSLKLSYRQPLDSSIAPVVLVRKDTGRNQ